MSARYDACVIGGGPAGASAAILLAQAGWQVSLVEQHVYPRQKVCGECVAAGNFALLDELGVGQAFRLLAGAPLTHVAWLRGDTAVVADMPACPPNGTRYGRALGRDVFDALLLERAREVGVRIWQPARVVKVGMAPGGLIGEIEHLGIPRGSSSPRESDTIFASLIIDAHGSWESGPDFTALGESGHKAAPRASDLFGFKATFTKSALVPGLLPVVAVGGGYGGMVVANAGRTTVAMCLRRDALRAIRVRHQGVPAGVAVESYLRHACQGVSRALKEAHREGSWLTVGPLSPGTRLRELPGVFRVGNAAGETHPLIGEGISMALQSSKLLAESLLRHANRTPRAQELSIAHHAYSKAWRASFVQRLRLAALYAHVAMRAPLAAPAGHVLRQWPELLATAARFAGKARPVVHTQPLSKEPV